MRNADYAFSELPPDGREDLIQDPAIKGDQGIGEILSQLTEHDSQDQSLSVVLDWAWRIRDEYALDWDDAIEIAMLAYYG